MQLYCSMCMTAVSSNTCTALNIGPGENALSAIKLSGAPVGVDVPTDLNIISLLEGQVALGVPSKVIQGYHPLYGRLRCLKKWVKRNHGVVDY